MTLKHCSAETHSTRLHADGAASRSFRASTANSRVPTAEKAVASAKTIKGLTDSGVTCRNRARADLITNQKGINNPSRAVVAFFP